MIDTVFAPATPAGGAIAVIRITGPRSLYALGRLFLTGKPLIPREMTFGRLTDALEGEKGQSDVIDDIMACFFKGPKSYTGEDMAELYLHGGQAVVRAALDALARVGLSPAAPGEFTRRAFMNGKLSLSRAEAVMDMINAVTLRSASSALEQLEGSVGAAVGAIEDALTDTLSGVDAALDYPEELEEDVFSVLQDRIDVIVMRLDALIEGGLRGRYIREGATVAILGSPNAGKSSLFNALVGSERAIVTPLPGTTRDTLEERISVCGVPVRLIDTAGIREARDEAERIGVLRALEQAEKADVLILAFDSGVALTHEDIKLLETTSSRERIAAVCKSDLPAVWNAEELDRFGIDCVTLSAATGEGIEALRSALASMLIPEGESALITNSRHLEALCSARGALLSLNIADGADCAAVLMHSALASIGEITGHDVSEDVIDRIFKNFCVGK